MEDQNQRKKYILIGLAVLLSLIFFSVGSYYLGKRGNKPSVPATSQRQNQASNDTVTTTSTINSKLKVGQRVRITIDTPTGVPVDGVIRVIQDVPGKKIGVELDKFTNYAHSLDRLVEEGKGWWTLEENLKVL